MSIYSATVPHNCLLRTCYMRCSDQIIFLSQTGDELQIDQRKTEQAFALCCKMENWFVGSNICLKFLMVGQRS